MIPLHNFNESEIQRIRTACSYLFMPELGRNDEFIKSVTPASVKKAFRDKAKMYHPDLHAHESREMLRRRRERFLKIQESYEYLYNCFLDNTLSVYEQGSGKGDIIAVGGAKGGIGKSIFAVNLAVFLSSIGKKTVLVDLDLGGANVHLYLGEYAMKGSINDFLHGTVPRFQDIAVHSKYGPFFIGGDSSQLGSPNITFAQKLKLLKAVKSIDADYVILDLGGDTTFNIIDFFLAADHGIVVTTCDPASYLEAYHFIKVALYRKLNRLFGAESTFPGKKDADLRDLIYEFTAFSNESRENTIGELFALIKEKQNKYLSFIEDAVSSYHPRLLVNRVTDSCNVNEVVERISVVSKKMLSVNVGYIGSLPYQQEIESSARELVPVIAKYPHGLIAKQKRLIVHKLLSY
ncbi:MAG: P-loop NTPase [Syntrophaceae bacterium]